MSDGDLNYVLTRMLWSFLDQNPGYTNHRRIYSFLEKLKSTIDTTIPNAHGYEEIYELEAIGVISNMIQETYRRKTAPYEDLKIKENGDVNV